jgi:hypothetical protein
MGRGAWQFLLLAARRVSGLRLRSGSRVRAFLFLWLTKETMHLPIWLPQISPHLEQSRIRSEWM